MSSLSGDTLSDHHHPGLTGLRAVAVVAVVAYHLGYLSGGFVGVDLFFVLSGFLITTLLLRRPPSSPAELGAWWGRRVRRLTPAVAVVVLVVLLVFLTTSGIARDSLATLTWWQNWNLILQGDPYWAPSPSPLRHAWSLSIEEQFYLLWPPILMVVLAAAGRSRRPERVLAALAGAGAVASFLWAARLASEEGADLSRVYFGTDTRAGALLLGCATAALLHRRPLRRVGTAGTAAALCGLGVLVLLSVVMSPGQRWTYTGGLALAAGAALVLVVSSAGRGPLTTALSWGPLQWLGDRSYAIYLWSWPVQVYLESNHGSLPRPVIAIVTVALTLPLASLSMRFVEEPLRRHTSWATPVRPRRAAWTVGVAVLAVATVTAASSTRPSVEERIAAEFERLPDPTTTVAASATPSTDTAPDGSLSSDTTTTCVPPAPPPTPVFSGDTSRYDPSTVGEVTDPGTGGCVQPGGEATATVRVLVLGDSTGRGAANGLRRTAPVGLEVWDRSELGCGMQTADSDCPSWRDLWPAAVAEVDPDVVLVHLGVSDDVIPGEDPAFMSDEARNLRRQEMAEAVRLLSASGARVSWILPAVPLDNGLFYCGGRRAGTGCDPRWIARWNEDLAAVAALAGVRLVDVGAWVQARGNKSSDRPDGLHLSGPALDAQAEWLAGQLI